jgi:formylglycine-generating enzyme required for sulfatase activity
MVPSDPQQKSIAAIGVAVTLFLLLLGAFSSTATVRAQATKATKSTNATQSVGTLIFTDSDETAGGAFILTLNGLAAPPTGNHYELWLHSAETSTLALGKVTLTNGKATVRGAKGENLLPYDRASLSVEADKNDDAAISEQIVVSATRPAALQQRLVELLALTYGSDPEAGATQGFVAAAKQQTQIAVKHTGFLRDALGETDMPQARRHTEHIINILDGKNGFMFGDLDRDGQQQNPGDGIGVRAYLDEAHTSALALVALTKKTPADQAGQKSATAIVTALENGQGLINSAFDNALQIFASDTITEASAHARDLTVVIDDLASQIDTAYQLALHMATYTFVAPTTALAPAPANTPTPTRSTTTTRTLTLRPTATLTVPATNAVATKTKPAQPAVATAVQVSVTIGQSWRNPADGSLYLYIAGGNFTMGSTAADAASPREAPQQVVNVADFWLQQTETTNAQYARCVVAGACEPPTNDRWDNPAYANHPVTDITWPQANAYAAWVGGRLPTEAEWEKACRTADDRVYPWGDASPTDKLSNYNNTVGDTTPVGSYPDGASPLGLVDLSGNAWEWVNTQDAAYPYDATDGREDQKAAGKRITRGGSFYYTQYQIRCAARTGFAPDTLNQHIGLRVAIDQPMTEWRHTLDQALYVYVPGGTFGMGAPLESAASPREAPQHNVTVAGFWLQQTETTNAQYGRCVAAGACTAPNNDRWDDPKYADHPVTHVDWQQANAYAAWVGGRLPTEAGWEVACRGDDDRPFPWGEDAPTASLSNFNNTVGDTTPVGSYPDGAGPFGALDQSGNVWEWASSQDATYPYDATDGREDASATGKRIVRGGSFYYTQYQIRCMARTGFTPDTVSEHIGFRVALDMPQ